MKEYFIGILNDVGSYLEELRKKAVLVAEQEQIDEIIVFLRDLDEKKQIDLEYRLKFEKTREYAQEYQDGNEEVNGNED